MTDEEKATRCLDLLQRLRLVTGTLVDVLEIQPMMCVMTVTAYGNSAGERRELISRDVSLGKCFADVDELLEACGRGLGAVR